MYINKMHKQYLLIQLFHKLCLNNKEVCEEKKQI